MYVKIKFKNKIYNPKIDSHLVYIYQEKSTGKVIYCGCGRYSRRFNKKGQELKPYNRMYTFNCHKSKYKEMYEKNLIDIFAICDGLTKKESLELETKWTEYLKLLGHCDDNKFAGCSTNKDKYGKESHHIKSVYCTTTGEYFECIVDACKKYGLQKGNVSKVLKGERTHTKGYSFIYTVND